MDHDGDDDDDDCPYRCGAQLAMEKATGWTCTHRAPDQERAATVKSQLPSSSLTSFPFYSIAPVKPLVLLESSSFNIPFFCHR